MTVKDLKKMLEKYPDNMDIITERCSDYVIVIESEWKVVKGVVEDCWVMRSHYTMSQENKKKEKELLLLKGN